MIIDGDLKFREHIISKVNIANRNVGIILGLSLTLTKKCF